jgi:hypothetical protein
MGVDERKPSKSRLTSSAIDRIVEAVGASHTPATLDRRELLYDVGMEVSLHRVHVLSRRLGVGVRRRKLQRALNLAQKLGACLEDDEIRSAFPGLRDFDTDGLVTDLEKAVAVAQDLRPAGLNASELFFGDRLPQVYEKHFLTRAGVSRHPDSGELGGPYLRFAEAVMIEVNRIEPAAAPTRLNISLETVAKVFFDVRAKLPASEPGWR